MSGKRTISGNGNYQSELGDSIEYLAGFAEDLLAIRNWERTNLPYFKPQIALDILLQTVVATSKVYPRPTKEVHLEIGYSQDRVRETIGTLVSEDWLIREPCASDRRMICLQPTERAVRLITQYKECVELSTFRR